MVDRRKVCLVFLIYFFRAANRRRKMRNENFNGCSQQIQGRLHKSLKATRVATLLYVNFLFVVFGFPLTSRLVCILHIYIYSSRTCEKNCHILIGCLFANLRLTHEPCLGITIVSLYCFGSPRRKFSNYSLSEQRSGHITEIANYSFPRLNYS